MAESEVKVEREKKKELALTQAKRQPACIPGVNSLLFITSKEYANKIQVNLPAAA